MNAFLLRHHWWQTRASPGALTGRSTPVALLMTVVRVSPLPWPLPRPAHEAPEQGRKKDCVHRGRVGRRQLSILKGLGWISWWQRHAALPAQGGGLCATISAGQPSPPMLTHCESLPFQGGPHLESGDGRLAHRRLGLHAARGGARHTHRGPVACGACAKLCCCWAAGGCMHPLLAGSLRYATTTVFDTGASPCQASKLKSGRT